MRLLLEAFDQQAAWCEAAAPFMTHVLRRTRHWLAADAEALAVFAAVAPDPLAAAVPLRWCAALHGLALRGAAPWAALWPPAAPSADAPETIDAALLLAWRSQRAAVDAALAAPPQTNEVQRSAALLPGLLQVAAATGLPLVLLEIGASAGLNLWCERYRHDHGSWQWGDTAAPLTLSVDWRGPAPAAASGRETLRIARRAGCDLHPVDLRQPDQALHLQSFTWPDQAERLARLRAASAAARHWMLNEPLSIEATPAANFVLATLAQPTPGHATVLMHSVVWQYIGATEQAAITLAVEGAAQRACAMAPLAWLRLEPAALDGGVELRCRLWRGAADDGRDHLLARTHPHSSWVEWGGRAPGFDDGEGTGP